MHDALFALKRTFHKSTWFGREILEPYALTPSRFDVLYMLEKTPRPFLWQSTLRKALGITAATMSIMVRALVRLGLVKREKSELDRRQLEVSLTERGQALIRRAMGVLFKQRLVPYFVRRIVSCRWWDKDGAFEDIDVLLNALRFMRDRMQDKAMLVYGAHPDD